MPVTNYNGWISYNHPRSYNGLWGDSDFGPSGGSKKKRYDRLPDEIERERLLNDAISDIYDRIHGLTPERRAEAVSVIVNKPKPERSNKKTGEIKLPPVSPYFLQQLMADSERVERLLAIRNRIMEEEVYILMLAL